MLVLSIMKSPRGLRAQEEIIDWAIKVKGPGASKSEAGLRLLVARRPLSALVAQQRFKKRKRSRARIFTLL